MQLFIHTTTTGSMRKMLFEFLLLIQKKEKSQFFWPIFWVLLSLARFSCLFLVNTWMNLGSFYEIPVKSHMQSYKSLVVYSFFFVSAQYTQSIPKGYLKINHTVLVDFVRSYAIMFVVSFLISVQVIFHWSEPSIYILIRRR